jgi:acyl-CoA synthetase (NDP forming)
MMKFEMTPLNAIFRPRSVAVIGASDNPGKLGAHVMKSLTLGGFPGKIYPVNPGRNEISGLRTYPSLLRIPDPVDLSIILLPAEQVPGMLRECGDKGVKGVVLISAGFKEIEARRGEALQREIVEIARVSGIRIIGPNTFGIVNLHHPLNATFTPEFSQLARGKISLVSQSGGMSHLIAFLAMESRIGLSKIIGLGNRCNVDFGDMIDFLSEDPETAVIALYLEGIDQPRRLMQAASNAAVQKPVIAYKVGRSPVSDRASQSHTGSLAGRHELYEEALKQAGVLTVRSAEELLDTAEALATSPFPAGNRVAVLSGQAGPAMAACDVCESGGLVLPPFSAGTQKRIEELLPPLAIRTNPVDLGPAWYSEAAIRGIVEAVLEDEGIDAVLLCVMFASANRAVAGVLRDFFQSGEQKKPVICCLSAPEGVWHEEIARLHDAGIPNYAAPERAAMALVNLARIRNLKRNGSLCGR